jgi:hypothetical protein
VIARHKKGGDDRRGVGVRHGGERAIGARHEVWRRGAGARSHGEEEEVWSGSPRGGGVVDVVTVASGKRSTATARCGGGTSCSSTPISARSWTDFLTTRL